MRTTDTCFSPNKQILAEKANLAKIALPFFGTSPLIVYDKVRNLEFCLTFRKLSINPSSRRNKHLLPAEVRSVIIKSG